MPITELDALRDRERSNLQRILDRINSRARREIQHDEEAQEEQEVEAGGTNMDGVPIEWTTQTTGRGWSERRVPYEETLRFCPHSSGGLDFLQDEG